MILFLLLLLIPLIASGIKIPGEESESPVSSTTGSSRSAPQSVTNPPQNAQAAAVFKILDEPIDEVLAVDDKELLYEAVTTEMPPESLIEALKVQAISVYTYYSRLRAWQREKPGTSLKGADFSTNISDWKFYTTRAEIQKYRGSKSDIHYRALGKVADTVYGQMLQDDGQLVCTTYYAISSGDTEAAKDIWGGDYSHLTPVTSPNDLYVSGYSTTVMLALQQVQQAPQKQWGISLNGDPSKWSGKAERAASGSITNQTLGGKTVKGDKVRAAFGLHSTSYTITYANGKFTSSTKGYGHGVGMSQAEVKYMAQHGSNYKQILEWYYSGAKLASI